MDDVYAVKKIAFLGKQVTTVCQNINGPCPLLAICNVLVLRGHLAIDEFVSPDGLISAHDLMRVVQNRLVSTNPLVPGSTDLAHLTREKTLQDVIALLPSLLVGLDVNVRFHKITDFEYTVACAVFDMLDIALVHGWLLDAQDENTMKIVENKSYNELVERLVEYRSVLMTESEEKPADTDSESAEATGEASNVDASAAATAEDELETKLAPPVPTVRSFKDLTIDTDVNDEAEVLASPSSTSSSSPTQKKSPSKQTVQVMMKERHISDTDALNTATVLLEEGPILEEFFNSSASQLTYYGLVKLHEEVRERQLCVFFRNNHFSTLFKCEGSLYLLVTDAGYLDEPTVVWERLNEIDGDTEYFNANFRPLNVSETNQQSILTRQEQEKQRALEAQQKLQDAQSSGESEEVQDSTSHASGDPDYLFALRLQEEEEARVNGPKRVSPTISPRRNPSPASRPSPPPAFETEDNEERSSRENSSSNDREESNGASQFEETIGQRPNETGFVENSGNGAAASGVDQNGAFPLIVDGQLMMSEEELEAQRQAERFYQERKRQFEQEAYQLQTQQQQQQQRANTPNRGAQQSKDGKGDCSVM